MYEELWNIYAQFNDTGYLNTQTLLGALINANLSNSTLIHLAVVNVTFKFS